VTQLKNTHSHEELHTALQNNVVCVNFRKADGSVRHMKATLQEHRLPELRSEQPRMEKSNQVFRVWDLEKQAWRSFRTDRLESWEIQIP